LLESFYNSPFGKIKLLSDGEGLCGLYFENQQGFLKEKAAEKADVKPFILAKLWLDDYFKGKIIKTPNELLIKPCGNSFRQAVWKNLLEIPYGKTTSYGEIAKVIAKEFNKEKMSAQAVGNAVKNNPISIIIPCHRVIGKNGNLTGYSGGLDLKIKLLKLEGAQFKKN